MTVSFSPQQTLQQKWVELRSLLLQEQRLLHGTSAFPGGEPQRCRVCLPKRSLIRKKEVFNLIFVYLLFSPLRKAWGWPWERFCMSSRKGLDVGCKVLSTLILSGYSFVCVFVFLWVAQEAALSLHVWGGRGLHSTQSFPAGCGAAPRTEMLGMACPCATMAQPSCLLVLRRCW